MLYRSQVAQALAKASAYDNRKKSDAAVEAWFEALQRHTSLTGDELLDAVSEHYATTRDFMMASDVYPAVKRIRARREVQESKQRALAAAPSAPASSFDREVRSRLNREDFQRARARGRAQHCEKFGLDYDGDGWTSRDRPDSARAGRVTAYDWSKAP